MSLPATWRQFQLFDFLPVRDPHYQSPLPLFSDPQLSAITAVKAHLAFAVNGHVKIVSKTQFSLVASFSAYEPDYSITFARPLPQSNILVTLAEKQGSPAVIKVWDLHKIVQLDAKTIADDDAMRHKYITMVSVHDGDDSYPISCFSFNDSLTCIALGYTSGKVLLVRGDLLRDRGSKQRLIYEGPDPVTSVQFNRTEEILYVVTTSRIFTLLTTGRNNGKPLRILSKDSGADLDCVDLDTRTSRLLVASTDGFTYYNTVSKEQVVGFNVAKRKILRLFKNYLLVVSPMEESSSGSSKTILTKLLVLDMFNMHVSFSLTIPNSAVSHVFGSAADHEAYLLSTDGVLYKLHEKPVNQQVELVIQRELFSIALNLARQHGLDAKTTMRINRLHAEYLYKRQDYDNATKKFTDCLEYFVEKPTVADAMEEDLDDFIIDVVTKFKEVSNIPNMTRFLKSLYESHLADCDHLTLLLCCYCKLKMQDELDAFIARFDLGEENASSNNRLDLNKLNFPLIINLFKECGYYSQVTLLLYKLNHPHMIVDIQLNDLKEYSLCLSYIKTLPVNELLGVLIDYSKKMLDVMPLETTKLLIEVFTGKYKPDDSHSFFETDAETDKEKETENEKTLKSDALPPPGSYVSSYSAILGYLSSTLKHEEKEATPEIENELPTYLPPRPSLVYSCFINHSREFVVFLEACYDTFDRYQGSVQEKENLISTLFEMYACISAENGGNDQTDQNDVWAEKARHFLEKNIDVIDRSRASLIAHMYGLSISDVFVKTRVENAEEDAFKSAQMTGDYHQALDIVHDFGERKPALYKEMLKFVVSSKSVFEEASRTDLQYLLEKITRHKLATPLEIIKILSSCESTSIGIVKDYLIDHFGAVNKEIANNEKLIDLYEKESTSDSVKLAELQTQPFVLQNNICSSCELKLEFPLIHFKCRHSYHQRCLNENTYIPETSNTSAEPRCPLCANDTQNAQNIRENQLRTKTEYDLFQTKLDESDDRFKVMCEYLGRGAME